MLHRPPRRVAHVPFKLKNRIDCLCPIPDPRQPSATLLLLVLTPFAPFCERVRLALLMCTESAEVVEIWEAFISTEPLSEWTLVLNRS